MPPPRTPDEVFLSIDAKSDEEDILSPNVDEFIAWVEAHLEQAQKQYPFMRSKTPYEWISVEESWNAANDFDPFASSGPGRLQQILQSGRMGMIDLGKLYGRVRLKLLPAIGTLLDYPESEHDIRLDYTATGAGAISYLDDHPSEAMAIHDYVTSSTPTASETRPKKLSILKARDGDKLRRFASLGWAMQEAGGGAWRKTGPVLVMDMDDKELRHHQPWLSRV